MSPSRMSLRALWSPAFVVCALLLASSAVGLRPALRSVERRFEKQTIALRRPLQELDLRRLHSFKPSTVRDEIWMSTAEMGTEDAIWLALEQRRPTGRPSEAFLLVSYYSDPHDKVPHTPEVCYRQGGWTVEDIVTVPLDVAHLGRAEQTVDLRVVLLKQATGPKLVVAYLFLVNGEFCHDREQVRWRIGRPGDRYIYFSKIEASVGYDVDSNRLAALETAKRLLQEGLAILVADHFPRDADLRGK